MSKTQTLVLCLVVVFVGAGFLCSDDGVRHGARLKQEVAAPPPPPPPPIEAVAQFLNLTEDQLAKWKDLEAVRDQEMARLEANIRDLDQQLQAQLKSSDPVAATVGELVIELKRAKNQRGEALETFPERFRAILTPAQIEKVDQVVAAGHTQRWLSPLALTGFLAPPPPPPPPPAPGMAPHAPAPPPPPPPPAPAQD
jgi:hypothetical protein